MKKHYLVISTFLLSAASMSYAADLTEDDMSQCHHYSSLAAKYQAAKQAHKSLEEALLGVDDGAERQLATEIYDSIDARYGVAEIKLELFQHCVKSFAQMRENERKS